MKITDIETLLIDRYLFVRVHTDGEQLARQTGLVDASGRPARGLPTAIVNGPLCDAEAAWRGAFDPSDDWGVFSTSSRAA